MCSNYLLYFAVLNYTVLYTFKRFLMNLFSKLYCERKYKNCQPAINLKIVQLIGPLEQWEVQLDSPRYLKHMKLFTDVQTQIIKERETILNILWMSISYVWERGY